MDLIVHLTCDVEKVFLSYQRYVPLNLKMAQPHSTSESEDSAVTHLLAVTLSTNVLWYLVSLVQEEAAQK